MICLEQTKILKSGGPGSVAGLSLIELMTALALSAGLILGVVTIYINSNQTSRLSASLARIQEAGRVVTEIVARDIRMVGFQGCADPGSIKMNIIANNPPTGNFLDSTLQGWEASDANWATGTDLEGTPVATNALVGSDIISIMRGEVVPIQVTGNMSSTNANIQVAGQLGRFKQDDIVLIADCENADLFRISSNSDGTWAHANNVNNTNRLSQAYNSSATIMKFSGTTYYVADTGRKDVRGNAIHALYRQTNDMNLSTDTYTIEELVEGVDSMQILYGELLSTGNIRYMTADAVADMNSVVGVKIGLLISHAESVLDNPDQLSYDLPGQTIEPMGTSGASVTHPVDNRIRRTFEMTISLRNRNQN
jgi:type IV pilus assembly protein PilW